MHILALDVGTSSVKAARLDVDTAQPVGPIARVGYELDQGDAGEATIPPERLWQAVCEAATKAAGDQRVDGVGLSCLSPALILLDAAGAPLTPIITHLDRRARAEAQAIWREVGPEFLASAGTKPLPGGMTAVGFRHLMLHDPALRSQVRWYLHLNGWLGLRLTGRMSFDPGNASFTGLYDTMGTRIWSPRWCEYFGVDPTWLPEVASGDVTLGALTSAAANALGLHAGLPVKPGAADTSSAMLAAGMQPGDLLHVVGTTQVLAVLAPNPQPATNRITRQLGVGNEYIHVTHNPVGGVALDWIHQLCFSDQSDTVFYEQSVPAVIDRPERVVLNPPFLGGDRLEIEPRCAGFQELSLATDRLDLLAAVLHAMRRHHYDALAALGQGSAFRKIFLTGRGADVVRRLIPDYSSENLVEGSLRGVARLFSTNRCDSAVSS